MTKKFKFPKDERLKSDIRIKEVYSTGSQLFSYPFKGFFLPGQESKSRICISAPKRLFKSAIDRNIIKRRSKEAYRLNKDLANHLNIDIYLIFIGKKVEDYYTIEKGLKKILSGINI